MGEGRGDVRPENGTVKNKAGTPLWLFCDSTNLGLFLGYLITGSTFDSKIKEGLGSPCGGRGGAVGTVGNETFEPK